MSKYRRPLDDDTLLSISVSATISRHRFDTDPADMLAEVRELAGDRTDILTWEAGTWAGYYGRDLGVQPAFTEALRAIGSEEAFALGRKRRAEPAHSAPNPPERRNVSNP